MSSVLDIIMSILFILFMIFIFSGYHRTKYLQREEELKKEEAKKQKEDE
jgi:hypothetical protein